VDERSELGARLLGAAATRRAAMGASDPLLSRDQAASTATELRRLLGPDSFDDAFAAGATLDVERGVS
jgi:hypothetical protein